MNMSQASKKSKVRRFLVAFMLALENIYRVNPSEKNRIVLVDKKDTKEPLK